MRYDLRLDLDTHCNLYCRYCDNRDVPKENKAHLQLTSIEPLLPAIDKSCWSVFLSCGGEPTMHPQFGELLQTLSGKLHRPDVSMVSNALLLDEKRRQWIFQSPIDRLLLSLDTLDPALFARLCGTSEDNALRIRRNIEAFALERRSLRNPPKMIVTAILMKSTLAGIPAIARWAVEHQITVLNLQWLDPLQYEEMMPEVLDPQSFEVQQTLFEVQKILRGSSVLLDWPREGTWNKLRSVWRNRVQYKNKGAYLMNAARKVFAKRRGMPCVLASQNFYLDPKGELNMCPYSAIQVPFPKSSQEFLSTVHGMSERLRHSFPERCKSCAQYLWH